MSEDKNIPCPFCEEVEVLEINHKAKAIECGGCGAIAPPSMYKPEDLDTYFEDVEKRWVTRPIENQLRAENEKLVEAMKLLQNWTKAYPLEMFPVPDLKLARKLLTDGGVSYDSLNAYSKRHVINGVGKIIDEALKGGEKDV